MNYAITYQWFTFIWPLPILGGMVFIYFINAYAIYPTIQCDFALNFKGLSRKLVKIMKFLYC